MFEAFNSAVGLVPALLAAGELATLGELMRHSLLGVCLDDATVSDGLAAFYSPDRFGWTTDDGHCHSTLATLRIAVRGLRALLEEDSDATRAVLRGWLPPATELLRIAEFECCWRACGGAAHPALLCAQLHGERLGAWELAVEVAEGLLRIETFHPLTRIGAHRLLGSAHAALGRRAAACEAAEEALAEAVRAKYLWLEMWALRDMLAWCEATDAEAVRGRLRGVAGRLAASHEELASVLGEGVL